ncbi:MAG: heat-shock protein Hsp20 [Planctomycetota bacterium]|nr:MAG: heat-shock protein Hsp20 [Planctomycetota bacterium]
MMNNVIPWKHRDAENAVATNDLSSLSSLRPNWDRLIEQFFGAPARSAPLVNISGPPLDLIESSDTLRVRAEVPGIAPADLQVDLSGDVLTITGEKREESEEHDSRRSYCERRFGRFSRSVRLPCSVEADQVTAEHEAGILTVTLPKSAAARSTNIAISTS